VCPTPVRTTAAALPWSPTTSRARVTQDTQVGDRCKHICIFINGIIMQCVVITISACCMSDVVYLTINCILLLFVTFLVQIHYVREL
jgi:hypothetical protein